MNTPTKITVSRIIAIVIMIAALFVLWIIGRVNPDFYIPNIGNSHINWLYVGLFIFFVLASFTEKITKLLTLVSSLIPSRISY